MQKFSRKTAQTLQHYVYVLVDPRTDKIFYVGRGSCSRRPFSHLMYRAKATSAKELKIQELRSVSLEPRVDILRHGLDAVMAKEIEAAVIDAIGLDALTNEVSGSGSSERGRLTAPQVEARLGGELLDIAGITESAILLHRRDPVPPEQLYDATRQFWPLSRKKIELKNENGDLKYRYAFAMRGNFVLEIYEILFWFEAGTTVSSRTFIQNSKKHHWEFIGAIAAPEIRNKYLNKSLMNGDLPLHPNQLGFRYLN